MEANKMSIVIPLGRGSRNNDMELRYCLRSIEKYLLGYGDIFIVGEKPDWLQNVIHIPCPDHGDKTYNKERNIFCKIMAACGDIRVTDNFLFMNDDHYLLQEYKAAEFPFYYDGWLNDYKTVTDYKNTVRNTDDYFLGGKVLYYDIHCPVIYKKEAFAWCMPMADWSKPFGYCIKTIYCHINNNSGQIYPDLKLNEALPYKAIMDQLAGRAWFSIGDKAFNGDIKRMLQELYPFPSKYEKRK